MTIVMVEETNKGTDSKTLENGIDKRKSNEATTPGRELFAFSTKDAVLSMYNMDGGAPMNALNIVDIASALNISLRDFFVKNVNEVPTPRVSKKTMRNIEINAESMLGPFKVLKSIPIFGNWISFSTEGKGNPNAIAKRVPKNIDRRKLQGTFALNRIIAEKRVKTTIIVFLSVKSNKTECW